MFKQGKLNKIGAVLLLAVNMVFLTACGSKASWDIDESVLAKLEAEYEDGSLVLDYEDATTFEAALNKGTDVIGKTVAFDVSAVKMDSALGYNLWSGSHLNFISEKKVTDVNEGDEVTAVVTSYENDAGSHVIGYIRLGTGTVEKVSTEETESEIEVFDSELEAEEENGDQTSTTAAVDNSSTVASISELPTYSGSPYVTINNNVPTFSDEDKQRTDAFESYSNLDSLGRCGVCYANICAEIEPTEKRGNIGSVKPTGWHTIKYDCVDGKYLYNRCHLIGYQLSGENANSKNLITGTRYMNVDGQLPFENMVDDYVDETGNHVLYRVTPIFEGNNLLASGVQMEAWSVEDNGAGICFNVYCFNVQPGITIDYATGDSALEGNTVSSEGAQKQSTGSDSSSSTYTDTSSSTTNSTTDNSSASSTTDNASSPAVDTSSSSGDRTVYITETGKKYHYDPNCRGLSNANNIYETTESQAKAAGKDLCGWE